MEYVRFRRMGIQVARVAWQPGIIRQFALLTNEGSGIIELGGGRVHLTDTKDQWIISQHENTAAALLIHEDFRNYFQRNGYTVDVAYYAKDNYLKNELKIAYTADTVTIHSPIKSIGRYLAAAKSSG